MYALFEKVAGQWRFIDFEKNEDTIQAFEHHALADIGDPKSFVQDYRVIDLDSPRWQ